MLLAASNPCILHRNIITQNIIYDFPKVSKVVKEHPWLTPIRKVVLFCTCLEMKFWIDALLCTAAEMNTF